MEPVAAAPDSAPASGSGSASAFEPQGEQTEDAPGSGTDVGTDSGMQPVDPPPSGAGEHEGSPATVPVDAGVPPTPVDAPPALRSQESMAPDLVGLPLEVGQDRVPTGRWTPQPWPPAPGDPATPTADPPAPSPGTEGAPAPELTDTPLPEPHDVPSLDRALEVIATASSARDRADPFFRYPLPVPDTAVAAFVARFPDATPQQRLDVEATGLDGRTVVWALGLVAETADPAGTIRTLRTLARWRVSSDLLSVTAHVVRPAVGGPTRLPLPIYVAVASTRASSLLVYAVAKAVRGTRDPGALCEALSRLAGLGATATSVWALCHALGGTRQPLTLYETAAASGADDHLVAAVIDRIAWSDEADLLRAIALCARERISADYLQALAPFTHRGRTPQPIGGDGVRIDLEDLVSHHRLHGSAFELAVLTGRRSDPGRRPPSLPPILTVPAPHRRLSLRRSGD